MVRRNGLLSIIFTSLREIHSIKNKPDQFLKICSREDLIDYVAQGNRVKYIFFWGHKKPAKGLSKSCFSQWYDSPFESETKSFSTAEHYMMYQKAMLFGDIAAAQKVLLAGSPGEAKSIGREVLGFNESIWQQRRIAIVVNANLAKFRSHPALREYLLNTGQRVLVEASPVDKIWGVGLAADDVAIEDPQLWKGQNLLGFALMQVRDQLSNSNISNPSQLSGASRNKSDHR
jgi:ribA/ribD-fused uncharacterized protein